MKRKTTIRRIFLFGLLAYLLLMGGLTAASVYSIYQGNSNLVQVAGEDLAYYLANGTFDPQVTLYGSNNFVYGPDGSRAAYQSSYALEQRFDVDGCARSLAGRAVDTGAVSRIEVSWDLAYKVAVAVALPMEDGGVFLFLKELPQAGETLFVLYFSVTLLSLLTTLYLAVRLRASESMEKAQREYIDNVNHELKSPIAAVKALAEPINDGLVEDRETLRRYSAIMLSELSHLERTISDMLELSRLQNRKTAAGKERLPAAAVFGDILDRYSVRCDEFGLFFSVSPPLEECPALWTNGALAARMLDILLSNAFKFTEASGRIAVSFREGRKAVEVTVRNDGPEIPAEARPHIFERFYQAGKAHDKGGSGLGLSIAREIALSLGEQLRLERSAPGNTAFSFTVQKAL